MRRHINPQLHLDASTDSQQTHSQLFMASIASFGLGRSGPPPRRPCSQTSINPAERTRSHMTALTLPTILHAITTPSASEGKQRAEQGENKKRLDGVIDLTMFLFLHSYFVKSVTHQFLGFEVSRLCK